MPFVEGIVTGLLADSIIGLSSAIRIELKKEELTKEFLKDLTAALKGEKVSEGEVSRICNIISSTIKKNPLDEAIIVENFSKPEVIAEWYLEKTDLAKQSDAAELAKRGVKTLFNELFIYKPFYNKIEPLLAQHSHAKTDDIGKNVRLLVRDRQTTPPTVIKDPNHKHFGLDASQSANFFDPEGILSVLAEAIGVKGTDKNAHPIQVLTGMGGIGKTMLARKFAHEYKDQFEGIHEINAESENNLLTDLSGLADEVIGRPSTNSPKAEPKERAREILKHLSSRRVPWLLIYDNVDENIMIKDWLPSGTCTCLITSRISEWGDLAQTFLLPLWNETNGAIYLKGKRKVKGGMSDLKALSAELGGLPLALSHAASYLKAKPLESVSTYRKEIRKRFEVCPKNSNYPEKVFATFTQAVDAIKEKEEGQEALRWLNLLAHLGPAPLTSQLLEHLAIYHKLDNDAIGLLTEYSLTLTTADRSGGYYTHRVVANVIIAQQGEDAHQHRDEVILWLAHETKQLELTDQKLPQYVPFLRHHETSFDETTTCDTMIREAHWSIMNCLGVYEMKLRGNFIEAERILRKNLSFTERHLPDHREILIGAINSLAIGLKEQGYHSQATKLFEKAKSNLDINHYHDVVLINNQAANLSVQGSNLKEAELRLRKNLEASLLYPGMAKKDHAVLYQNLGANLVEQEKYEEAKPYVEIAYRIKKSVLDKNDPSIAFTSTSKATILFSEKKYDEAESYYREALEITINAKGKDHSDTAVCILGLAHNLIIQGRSIEAEPIIVEALKIFKKRLPAGHQYIAIAEQLLAQVNDSKANK